MAYNIKDIFASLVVIAFSIIVFVLSNDIQSMTDTEVGPEFFPKAIAIIMFILGMFMIVTELIKLRKAKGEGVDWRSFKQFLFKKEHINASITILILLLYVYFITKIGFLISSALYLLIHFLILGERKSWNIFLFIVLALIVSIGVFYLFRSGFSVRLPSL